MTPSHWKTDIAAVATQLGEVGHDFAAKTVILTGAGGFLGRYFSEVFAHLNEHVLDAPCKLYGFDNLITSGALCANLPTYPHITFRKHDVIHPLGWDAPVDFIVHAAGIASPFHYRAFPLETLEVAVTGTRNMLELAAKNHARFTFFSSSEIYGDPLAQYVPTQESYRGNVSCRGPRACYDESKRVGETLCNIFHDKYSTATTTVRPFNVYGPGMQETDYRVLPNFASRIKGGLPLHIYGSGKQTRTFCYVTDALAGFLRVIARGVPGEAYNIGNPLPEITIIELVRRIETVLGRPVAYNLIEYPDSYPTDEPMRRCPDIRKAQLQIGYQPRVDLDEGLRRFLRWTDRTYTGAM